MSGLTPEAARVAAAYLETLNDSHGANLLCAKADRLEAAAKTPGQVLAEHQGLSWLYVPPSFRVTYENRAAAVIAHHVGPDRVVVDRGLLLLAEDLVRTDGHVVSAAQLREALS